MVFRSCVITITKIENQIFGANVNGINNKYAVLFGKKRINIAQIGNIRNSNIYAVEQMKLLNNYLQ